MTQLIIDGLTLPESQKGRYKAYKDVISQEVTMITGRMVREVRGAAWVIEYQYGYFDEETKNSLLAKCEKGRQEPITCSFLPQESSEALTTSEFFVTSFTRPKFMWSRNGSPLWGDFSFTLREVSPSD